MSHHAERIYKGKEYHVDLRPLGYYDCDRQGDVVATTGLIGDFFKVKITLGLESYRRTMGEELRIGVDSDFHKAMTLIEEPVVEFELSFDDMMNGVKHQEE